MKKKVAVILVRGGSKGIPRENLSTEDQEIAELLEWLSF